MSEVLSKKSHYFYTDLGAVVVDTEVVQGYDVEDVISDKVLSQAQILRFENITANRDVNADSLPRQIEASGYL